MLPKTKMVKQAIERLYDGECTIVEHKPFKDMNRTTSFRDVILYEKEPCRLSFQSLDTTQKDNGAAEIKQVIKLFIAPDINIPAGCKITVTQNGVTADYKSSGVPAVYTNHQEIILELFERWA